MICQLLLRLAHLLMPCRQEIAHLLEQKRRAERLETASARRTLAQAKITRRHLERSGIVLSIEEIDEALGEQWHRSSSRR